jgi:hypothetical protein
MTGKYIVSRRNMHTRKRLVCTGGLSILSSFYTAPISIVAIMESPIEAMSIFSRTLGSSPLIFDTGSPGCSGSRISCCSGAYPCPEVP